MGAKIINQPDLFGTSKAPAKGYEVHEHCFISGPRSHWAGSPRGKLVHSHAGGDVYHTHPDTGPASFTIDKDEWFAATGLRGGSRKKFTKAPTGEQLPYIERQPGEGEFEIHVGPNPPDWPATATGGGYAAACRMVMACDNRVTKVVPFDPKRKRA